TRVPYTVHFGGGKKQTVFVNQNQNQGRWNSLGTYEFDGGKNGKVVISNDANGLVAADAIMFVFRDNSDVVDVEPPSVPSGVRVEGN
ncbi:MAG: hypothetical protein D6743_10305, partial [Calditrichaeota bacterium]